MWPSILYTQAQTHTNKATTNPDSILKRDRKENYRNVYCNNFIAFSFRTLPHKIWLLFFFMLTNSLNMHFHIMTDLKFEFCVCMNECCLCFLIKTEWCDMPVNRCSYVSTFFGACLLFLLIDVRCEPHEFNPDKCYPSE